MRTIISKICKWIGLPGAVIIISCVGVVWLIGCATNNQSSEVATGKTGKSGAQLWAENCNRCHNIRSPSNYSPAQWEVVMMHMRVRANLTPEEHKKILEFLKSGT
jgi:hypothetical protein